MTSGAPWSAPSAGDIVWSIFPELPKLEPGPKPRPALVLSVQQHEDGCAVTVVYGTSQAANRLKVGEVAITRDRHPAAYALASLAYDTKFDFKQTVDLPWSQRYFKAPALNKHGNTPRIGTLHATVMHAVEAAYRAAMQR